MTKLDQLINQLEEATASIKKEILPLEESSYHQKPGTSWSVSDILVHLYILEGLINKVLTGNATDSGREIDEKVEQIKSVFLNFDQKLNAPDIIRPKPDVVKTKEEMLEKFTEVRTQLIKILKENPLNEVCMDYAHAQFGELTRLEWGYFILYHSLRHIEQMRKAKSLVVLL